jgi:hypothetical protein
LPVLVDSAYFFRPSKEGTNAVVFASENNAPLRISGFVWEGNTERLLRGTSYIFEEPWGAGASCSTPKTPTIAASSAPPRDCSSIRFYFNSQDDRKVNSE